MRTIVTKILISLSIIVMICSCNLIDTIGPARPDIKATEYLKSTGVPDVIINKIVDKKEISREDFEKYGKSWSVNVRYLIASNPYVPSDLLYELIKDENRFVRQGAASSILLNKEMIEILKNDKYYGVQCSLVGNPSVPDDIILQIYKTNKKVPLYGFGLNPKCPEEIKNDILKSNDEKAKFWLDYSTKKEREKNKETPIRNEAP